MNKYVKTEKESNMNTKSIVLNRNSKNEEIKTLVYDIRLNESFDNAANVLLRKGYNIKDIKIIDNKIFGIFFRNINKYTRWIEKQSIESVGKTNIPVIECSNCGIYFCDLFCNYKDIYNYCPNCGAKME